MKSKIVNLLIVAALSVSSTVPAFANVLAKSENTVNKTEITAKNNSDNNKITTETIHVNINELFALSNSQASLFSASTKFKNSYSKYRDLLDAPQKEIYDFLTNNFQTANTNSHTLTFKNQLSKSEATAAFKQTAAAFYLDNPLMYWCDDFKGEFIYQDRIAQSVTITVQSKYYYNYDLQNTKMSKIMNKVNSIISSMNKEKFDNDLDKFTYLHDTLMNNTTYDTPAATDKENHLDSHNPYGALVLGKSVCEGNTLALTLLCHEADIDCLSVIGGKNKESHAWNYVKLDGKWRFVDPTYSNRKGVDYKYCYFLRNMPSSYLDSVPLALPTLDNSYFINFGDVDRDGIFTMNDASLALQKIYSNSLSGADKVIIDVNGSGTCDDTDVNLIKNKVLNGTEFSIYQKLNNYK